MILLVLYYIHCTQMFDFDNFRPLLSPNVSFKVHSAQQYLRVKLAKFKYDASLKALKFNRTPAFY